MVTGDPMTTLSNTGNTTTTNGDNGAAHEAYVAEASRRLASAMAEIGAARCRRSERSMLDLFRKELRDCRRSSSISINYETHRLLMTSILSILTIVINYFKCS